MISTRDLSALPDVDALKRLMQSMAMLDAVLSPEWQFRYYSFSSKWAKGEQLGSMRNGCGDELFALFNKHGCFLKGFAHEAKMTPYRENPPKLWPGLLTGVPAAFNSRLNDPAAIETTFFIWRRYGDAKWNRGKFVFPPLEPYPDGSPQDPDGSIYLLSPYDGKPETYLECARDYFAIGENLTIAHVRHVYAQKPLTTKLVQEINPKLTLADLKTDTTEIGYPRKK